MGGWTKEKLAPQKSNPRNILPKKFCVLTVFCVCVSHFHYLCTKLSMDQKLVKCLFAIDVLIHFKSHHTCTVAFLSTNISTFAELF